jgi:hypothetical protein
MDPILAKWEDVGQDQLTDVEIHEATRRIDDEDYVLLYNPHHHALQSAGSNRTFSAFFSMN